ncbi:MAG: ABC transporter permease, partial [Acidobacteriia bacterium]|nr:ABC transporter permease [Terriglobia bacterium]
MEAFVNDVRYSFRFLRQNRALTSAAIAALTLGIGANTAVFSIVNAVLLRPLSAPEPERMVSFVLTFPQGSAPGGAAQHFFFWRKETHDFQDVSAHRLELVNLTGGPDPEQIPAGRVSADFFHLFGAAVIHGRTFTPDEDRPRAGHFAVLSYGLWARRFGKDPEIVGKTISINSSPHVVTGILGARFDSEQFGQAPELWIPFQMDPESTEGGCYCHVTGRLRPGITLAGAKAHLEVAAEEFRRAFPKRLGPRMGFGIQPLQESMAGDVRSTLMILVVAVVFVLLIACANVASLMLASSASRGREIAIRAAIGAGRLRIVRQLLVESALLSLAGGVLGLLLGLAGIRLILALYPNYPLLVPVNTINLPRIGEHGSAIGADWRVLAFTVGVSVLTTLLFGLIPALQASGIDLSRALKEGSGRSGSGFRQNKTRALLVVGEIALALILVVGGALLIRTLIALRSVNPGFDAHQVLVMQTSLAGE